MAKLPIQMVIPRLRVYHQAQSCLVIFRPSTVIFLHRPFGIGL